ncbi:MAG: GIY-YIG nuclease family protein [Patescibacteria group bacterium]
MENIIDNIREINYYFFYAAFPAKGWIPPLAGRLAEFNNKFFNTIMYYVYVLKNTQINKIYIGVSSNLIKRIKEHNSGKTKTTKNGNWRLVYYEAYLSKKDATQREWNLKNKGRQNKFLKENIKNSLIMPPSSSG